MAELTAHVHYEGIVHADVSAVWNTFKGFGESTLKFWETYARVELDGDDEVGVVRTVWTIRGDQVREKLEVRNNEEFRYEYSFVDMKNNPGVNTAWMIVTMKAASDDSTRVTFNDVIDCTTSDLATRVRERFETITYPSVVKGLNRLLNPVIADMTAHVRYQGVVNAQVSDVWNAFRGFGEPWLKFSENMTKVELDGEDTVGVIRTVWNVHGNEVREKLDVRDDENFRFEYSMVDMKKNPGVKSARMIVTMKADSEKSTLLTFEGFIEGISSVMANVFRRQMETVTYPSVVRGLDRLLSPIVADLTVSQIRANGLPKMDAISQSDTFVRFSIVNNDGRVIDFEETLAIDNCSNPSWYDELEFPIGENFKSLSVEVMDKDIFQRDQLILGGEIDVTDIKSIDHTYKIVGSEVDGEDQPQLEFKIDFILRKGKKVENLAMVSFMAEQRNAMKLVSVLDNVKKRVVARVLSLLHNPHYKMQFQKFKFRNFDTSGVPAMPQTIPIDRMIKPKQISTIVHNIMTALYSFSGAMKRVSPDDIVTKWTSVFNPDYFPMTPTIQMLCDNWKDDAEFCRQFMQGINPFLIRIVQDLEKEVPEDMLNMEVADEGVSVEELFSSKRLLIVDYELMAIEGSNEVEEEGFYRHPTYNKYIYYAPIVLLYKSNDELFPGGHNLKPLGIQLTRFADKPNRVFTPQDKQNIWLYAKMHVQSCDAAVMQFVTHLGYSHFQMDPVAISYHNWKFDAEADESKSTSPIIKMLEPHLDNVIGMNWFARQTLLLEAYPITDRFFSCGTLHGVRMYAVAMSKLEYANFCFPRELASRGFGASEAEDGIKGYLYRDDGHLLWETLQNYASMTVDSLYESDDDVVADGNLQQFLSDIGDPNKGNLRSFRSFHPTDDDEWKPLDVSSKTVLTEVLTSIIYQASAYHAVQNNPQQHYISFMPTKPQTLTMPMPMEQDADLSLVEIYQSMPDFFGIGFQCFFGLVLTPLSPWTLSQVTALKDVVPAAHDGLMEGFAGMKSTIDERNTTLEAKGEITYPYFLPEQCNASVDF